VLKVSGPGFMWDDEDLVKLSGRKLTATITISNEIIADFFPQFCLDVLTV
jgi:hypothetical protein